MSNLQRVKCIRIEGHIMICECTLSVLFHIALHKCDLVVFLCPCNQFQPLLMAMTGVMASNSSSAASARVAIAVAIALQPVNTSEASRCQLRERSAV